MISHYTLHATFPDGKQGEILQILDENDLGLMARTCGYDIWPEMGERNGFRRLNIAVLNRDSDQSRAIVQGLESLGYVEDIEFGEHEVLEPTPESQARGQELLEQLRADYG